MCCHNTTPPPNAGNLSVKTKAAHINPGALGAPEVTNLERGGHFAQRNLIYASIWSILFRGRTRTAWTQHVAEIYKKCYEQGPRGSIRPHYV